MEPDYTRIFTDGAIPELAQLVPLALFVIVFLFAFDLLKRAFGPKRRGKWRGRRSNWSRGGAASPWPNPRLTVVPVAGSRIPDAADQLRTVMGAAFKPKRLLNRGESRVLAALEPLIAELAPGWRIMAQVSLGEVLDADSTEAFNTINAKRVDLLLVDADFRPRHAIEYQGQGHHQGTAAARDAVKKEALRRAGVGYIEVFAGDTPAELRRVVEKLVRVELDASVIGSGSRPSSHVQ
jgi:hypothetical protein